MSPKKYSERKREERASANSEVVGVIFIIISAFLLLCLLTGGIILGVIGQAITNVLLSLFGYSIFPLLLFFLIYGIIKVQKRTLTIAVRYVVGIIIIALCVVSIAHLATSHKYLGAGFSSYISSVYSGRNTVGGVIFGVVVYGVHSLVSTVFSYVLYSLIILTTLFFMSRFYNSLPSVRRRTKKRTAKRQSAVSIKSSAYAEGGSFGTPHGGGLFVGNIIRSENVRSQEGSFDSLREEPVRSAPPDTDDRDEIERIYDRENARKILFEDNREAYERFLPKSLTAEPSVKREESAPVLPDVPIPPQKPFDHKYVMGEIINGDEISERLSKDAVMESPAPRKPEIVAEPQPEVVSYTPPVSAMSAPVAKPTEPTKPTMAYTPRYNPGKIINGDYYVVGEEPPVLIVEETAVNPVIADEPHVEPEKPEIPAVKSGYETVYTEPASVESDETDYEHSYYHEPKIEESEETPDIYVHDSAIVADTAIYDDPTEFSAETEYEDDYDDENAVSDEVDSSAETSTYAPSSSSFYERETEVVSESEETEELETVASEPIEDKSEPEQKSPETYTSSSFNIIEEVEDLSERSFENPNDTTGYYNRIEEKPSRTPFEERAHALDRKISRKPAGDQIDIEDFAHKVAEQKQISKPKPKQHIKYIAPPLDLLVTESTRPENGEGDVQKKIMMLEDTLEKFGVPAKVNAVTVGPAVTRYELDMPPGMSVRKIETLADDIRYSLACSGQIRIESPIPGKRAVGIEIPNDEIYTVALKDIISSPEFKNSSSPLTIALGKDIQGKIMITRLDKMPHLLIAGMTGSGKSSCLNSLLISLLYKSSPEDVRLILIDPKRVEFTPFNGLPHLMIPNAITDVSQAINAFKWVHDEMERRYVLLQQSQLRNIQEYNSSSAVKEGIEPKLPFIVVVVDELANLIMASPANRKTLEDVIMAVASKARAAGIHLVLATQRPSVDVITGTIKANLPSRIAFAVSSAQNSRIILDNVGAEALLGRGDMLFAPLDESIETRIQGAFVESFEVKNIVGYIIENNPGDFDTEFESAIVVKESSSSSSADSNGGEDGAYDKELIDVARCVIKCGNASSSLIQRRFRFGWNKAARIMEQMEELGFIGPQSNSNKAREVFITRETFEDFFGEPYE